MLRPSYSELMTLLNEGSAVDSKITSRYTIVIAAAKRARQLIDGAIPLSYATTDKAVSTAVREMNEGKLKIVDQSPDSEAYYKALHEQMNKEQGSLDDTF